LTRMTTQLTRLTALTEPVAARSNAGYPTASWRAKTCRSGAPRSGSTTSFGRAAIRLDDVIRARRYVAAFNRIPPDIEPVGSRRQPRLSLGGSRTTSTRRSWTRRVGIIGVVVGWSPGDVRCARCYGRGQGGGCRRAPWRGGRGRRGGQAAGPAEVEADGGFGGRHRDVDRPCFAQAGDSRGGIPQRLGHTASAVWPTM
jgi:hypothetical protein